MKTTLSVLGLVMLAWLLPACTNPSGSLTPLPTLAPTSAPPATSLPPTERPATSLVTTPFPSPTPEVPPPTPTVYPPPDHVRLITALEQRSEATAILRGLVRTADGWAIEQIDLPLEAPWMAGWDYATASNALLFWDFGGGAGPANLAVGELYLYYVATDQLFDLMQPESKVVVARWLPDGNRFVFLQPTGTTYELRLMNLEQSSTLLADDVVRAVTVSPSGRYVAFTRESRYTGLSTPPGLYVVELASGIETKLSDVDRGGYGGSGRFADIAWAPDETSLMLNVEGTPDTESGYEWAATDGSSAFRVVRQEVQALLDDLNQRDEALCLSTPWLFDGRRLVIGAGPCVVMGESEPDSLLLLELDPATQAVAASRLVPVGPLFVLLTWAPEGDAVLVGVGENAGGDEVLVVDLMP